MESQYHGWPTSQKDSINDKTPLLGDDQKKSITKKCHYSLLRTLILLCILLALFYKHVHSSLLSTGDRSSSPLQVIRLQYFPPMTTASPEVQALYKQLFHCLYSTLHLDVWRYDENSIDVSTVMNQNQLEEAIVKAIPEIRNITLYVSTLNADIQVLIQKEAQECKSTSSMDEPHRQDPLEWFQKYHSYEEIHTWYKNLTQRHAHLVSYSHLGQSSEGRSLFAIKVTGAGGPEGKKSVFYFQAGTHGRDWTAVAVMQYLCHHVIHAYGYDSAMTKLLDRSEFIFVPLVNPDGYAYSWKTDRLWKKNRVQLMKKNVPLLAYDKAFGVNLDRNWPMFTNDTMDGLEGSEPMNPYSHLYRGPQSASELEVHAIMQLLKGYSHILAAVQLSAYGPAILRPLAYTPSPPPHDSPYFRVISDQLRMIFSSVHGKSYHHWRVGALGSIYGTWMDYLYHHSTSTVFQPKYVLDIHVRDGHFTEKSPSSRMSWGGIISSCKHTIPTGQELIKGVAWFAQYVLDNPLV